MQTYLINAYLEKARREQQRRAKQQRLFPVFADWLQTTSPAYTWDWAYLRHIQAYLAQVTRGAIKRLMIFCPPRHGKSLMTTIHYPVYRMEREPGLRVIVGSYGKDLSQFFSRQSRRIAEKRGLLGVEGVRRLDEWETVTGSTLYSVGVGSSVVGRGAGLIVIDDPTRSREEAESERYRERVWDWYTNDLYTRLEPDGAIVLIQTRWHQADLAGRILESDDAPNWTVVSLPAEAEANDPLGRAEGEPLCPDRFDHAALQEIKQIIGVDFSALYQQRPVAREGTIYKQSQFGYADPPHDIEYVIQAWDTASSKYGDYSACVTIGIRQNTAYILHVFRDRLETTDLLQAVKNQAVRWRPRVIVIEDASSGTALQQMLRRETRLPIIAVQPFRGGKIAHAQTNMPYFDGRVVFCPGPWLSAFEAELLAFPSGTFDDQVDALNYGLDYVFQSSAMTMTSFQS
jgi:predicted phage terminase large subunit-like protein